ncbi:MAG: glutathione binding-like protein [Pseudomonadota bacterium]
MIDLYTADTPNGWKASIMLDECGIEYKRHNLDLSKNDQKTPDYLKINPNGRIPAMHDHETGVSIFESGAILLYLAERTGKFLPADPVARSQVMQWVMWQMGGLGPMQGQANVFFRYFPEKIQPAIDRYQNETKRLYTVLDTQLADNEYVAGSEYSIADMASWPWVIIHFWAGVEIDDLPNLKRWMDQVKERPVCAAHYKDMEENLMAKADELLEMAKKIMTK